MTIESFKIDNIKLQNYKKYQDLELKFPHRFMLIIGENGAGKTSILDGIATFMGGYLQSFSEIPTKERHSIKKEDINVKIVDQNNNLTTQYNVPVIVSGQYEINNNLVKSKRLRQDAKGGESTKLLKNDNLDFLNITKSIDQNTQSTILPILSYHGTGRLWEQPSKQTNSMENLTRFDGYKDCLNAKSNYKNFINWFGKMEFNAFQLGEQIPILEAVRNIVIEMLSKLTENKVELFKYRESDLEIKYVDEDLREKVSNLSDGFKNMIGIVSDVAYRMAILNPNLGVDATKHTSGIVLIDELDLHLHPKWQRQIVDILMELFPKVQFIATTHSPFIIQSIGENSLIKLDESGTAMECYDDDFNPIKILQRDA